MKLNVQLISLALLSLSGAAAMSQEAFIDVSAPIVSSASRADVRNAAIKALRDGSLPRGEASFVEPVVSEHASVTRGQVSAEAREALRLGLVAYGEGISRAATPDELAQIRQAGLRAAQSTDVFAAR